MHLLLGAVLALPYLALTWLFVTSVSSDGLDAAALGPLLALAAAAAVAVVLVPGVRALEVTAARALLDVDLPDPDPESLTSWSGRRRAVVWLLLNMLLGVLIAVLTLIAAPSLVGFLLAPWRDLPTLPTGPAAAWTPVVGLLFVPALLYAVAGAGEMLARLAPRLLGPTTEERLAGELADALHAADALAERNRLARELHDSVGHALTVTTLQAGAAARLLDSDPEFVRRALEAIADAGRAALDDLDHVLGLLREGGDGGGGGGAPAPQPDLTDLARLLDGARSAGVDIDVTTAGDLATVPAVVSREAYRIIQEGLTNALRHAGPVPVAVRIDAAVDVLALTVSNPLRRKGSTAGGGRGLRGMAERVRVLRGELSAGPADGCWRVTARLPLSVRR
ncbi:histidine kinase [Pseudonocardia asaccharolytica DSM 44247 = NBRC 16224]|uniref:histidine kinase n=1 Tax=Pseudonocardia asaccharolytica DSM 44247 = NBRC 16224 TaxID=1123024 RepID=A0A511D9I3_9PSEU|nr:histidine kinase [Pseudonocardia asaccharolytica DSM 44247 = NBRC 16224]